MIKRARVRGRDTITEREREGVGKRKGWGEGGAGVERRRKKVVRKGGRREERGVYSGRQTEKGQEKMSKRERERREDGVYIYTNKHTSVFLIVSSWHIHHLHIVIHTCMRAYAHTYTRTHTCKKKSLDTPSAASARLRHFVVFLWSNMLLIVVIRAWCRPCCHWLPLLRCLWVPLHLMCWLISCCQRVGGLNFMAIRQLRRAYGSLCSRPIPAFWGRMWHEPHPSTCHTTTCSHYSTRRRRRVECLRRACSLGRDGRMAANE